MIIHYEHRQKTIILPTVNTETGKLN